jgi:branched-chain amino acid transport system permease protein
MTELLASLVRGLGLGSTYGLIAIGFVLVYKATGVFSFAQPAFMVTGAVAVSYLVGGLNFWLSCLLAVTGTALLALGVERVVIRPMIGQPVFTVSAVTLGVDIVIRVVTDAGIGGQVRHVGDPWGLAGWGSGSGAVQQRFVAMLVTSLVVTGALVLLFRRTRLGLAMRAVAADQEVARAEGVAVGRVFALSWALAGALAATAGILVGTGAGIDRASWMIALKALPAIVLGGLDSVGGALAGGLTVGVVESLVGTYQPTYVPWLGDDVAVVSPYILMLVVLWLRPYGLFGTPETRRV